LVLGLHSTFSSQNSIHSEVSVEIEDKLQQQQQQQQQQQDQTVVEIHET
jgi:hypothetical protein